MPVTSWGDLWSWECLGVFVLKGVLKERIYDLGDRLKSVIKEQGGNEQAIRDDKKTGCPSAATPKQSLTITQSGDRGKEL